MQTTERSYLQLERIHEGAGNLFSKCGKILYILVID